MKKRKFTRRQVIATTSAAAITTLIDLPYRRYKKEFFNNVPKKRFIEALQAEGIPAGSGYGPQNKYGLVEEALSSRGYKRLYGEARLRRYREEDHLPGNDQLCEEAVTFYQSILLGSRSDMDDIVSAIIKIYENRDQLIKKS